MNLKSSRDSPHYFRAAVNDFDRDRAFALWEGWFGYDRKKYAAMLREPFEPFERPTQVRKIALDRAEFAPAHDWARFPLFAGLRSPDPRLSTAPNFRIGCWNRYGSLT